MNSLLPPLSVFPLSLSTLKCQQHRRRLPRFLSWNPNRILQNANQSPLHYAIDRKPHSSRFVNRQSAFTQSECVDWHPQWYISFSYSSPQLGCCVTPRKESVHTTPATLGDNIPAVPPHRMNKRMKSTGHLCLLQHEYF